MLRQRTILRKVGFEGIGLHSGKLIRTEICPAESDKGIIFRRIDIVPHRDISLNNCKVTGTQLASTISENNIEISTVEHLVAALSGLGIDNVLVKVSGKEIPILDGSAAIFVYLLKSAGCREQNSAKKFITKPIPLFPGYIFVSFSMSNLNWRSINSTLGVKKLVESNKIPQCIPQEFIASLKHRCDKEGKLVGEETLNVGAKVRIVKGPFTEMIGTIEKIDAKDRITLLLDFMGKDTKALFVNSYMKYIC